MNSPQTRAKRFVYFYFNRNEPDEVRKTVPAHVRFWHDADLTGYMGGPFADRSGGLISFLASSLEAATEIIQQDPFIGKNLIEQKWIKEWVAEEK